MNKKRTEIVNDGYGGLTYSYIKGPYIYSTILIIQAGTPSKQNSKRISYIPDNQYNTGTFLELAWGGI